MMPYPAPRDYRTSEQDQAQTPMAKLRYYDAADKAPAETPKAAVHTEFLRTGRIDRRRQWMPEQRRYLSYAEVAEQTGRKLAAAGETTHRRINAFHASIQFPKMVFHRTLASSPHLGYCHVTAAKTRLARAHEVTWSFYFANFFSELGDETHFFDRIQTGYSRMYFAVAIEPDEAGRILINRDVRGNGLIFQTQDPRVALKNVLMLGARDDALRRIIRRL